MRFLWPTESLKRLLRTHFRVSAWLSLPLVLCAFTLLGCSAWSVTPVATPDVLPTATPVAVPTATLSIVPTPIPSATPTALPPILAGQVHDVQDGRPLTEARFLVGSTSSAVGADGRFEIALAPGRHQVQVAAEGYVTAQFTATLDENPGRYEYIIYLAHRKLQGMVLDLRTQQPVAEARLVYGQVSAFSDRSGSFELDAVTPAALQISHVGYLPAEMSPAAVEARFEPSGTLSTTWTLSLTPRVLVGTIREISTTAPISGALIASGDLAVYSDAQGHYELSYVEPGITLTVASQAYRPLAGLAYTGQLTQDIALERLQFSRLMGELHDKSTGAPIPKALVQVFVAPYTESSVPALLRSDAEGRFAVEDVAAVDRITIKAPGYRRTTVPVTATDRLDLALEPFESRGIYIPFGLLTVPKAIDDLFALMDGSELNTVVVDVKSDGARLAWRSTSPVAQEIGAYLGSVMDLREFLRKCQERHLYTVARIVVFKDTLLAQKHPEWAIKRTGGTLYLDFEGLAWVDPTRQEVRDYMVSLAREVADMGFDEVQFDYLRFPSDGQIKDLTYSQENTPEKRTAAMAEFCAQTYAALSLTPAFFSADVFGLTVWVDPSNDMGIGQRVVDIVPSVDYISPMLYPSTFIPGNLGLDAPGRYPYEVISRSVLQTEKRIQEISGPVDTRVRPWLQHYALANSPYGPPEFLLQKMAAEDAQSCGWVFWNAGGAYEREIFMPGAYERFQVTKPAAP